MLWPPLASLLPPPSPLMASHLHLSLLPYSLNVSLHFPPEHEAGLFPTTLTTHVLFLNTGPQQGYGISMFLIFDVHFFEWL